MLPDTREVLSGKVSIFHSGVSQQQPHTPFISAATLVQVFSLLSSGPLPHIWILLWTFIGEGDGAPLQCSCLENPTDRGAW